MQKEINTAHWHYSTGIEFQDAFYLLIEKFDVFTEYWRENVEKPSYYCAGLAIEHFLKGYLTLKKIQFPNKSGKGHDLNGLIKLDTNNISLFFNLEKDEIEQIEVLNSRYYKDEVLGMYDLRYPTKPGLRKSPHPDTLNRIVKKMGGKLFTELQTVELSELKPTSASCDLR